MHYTTYYKFNLVNTEFREFSNALFDVANRVEHGWCLRKHWIERWNKKPINQWMYKLLISL